MALTTAAGFVLLGISIVSTSGWFKQAFFLGIIALCVAAGIITVGILSYKSYARNYRIEAEKQLESVAELKVNELSRWREERLGNGQILFENPVFSRLVERFLSQPEDTEAQGQIRTWLEKIKTGYAYRRVFLLDCEGIEKMSVPAGAGAENGPLRHACEVIDNRRVAFADFHRHSPDEPVLLSVQIPVFDASDTNRPLGVCVLQIDPSDYLYPFIQHWPVPSDSAETLIVRREGSEAVFLNQLRFNTNPVLTVRSPLSNTDMPAVQAVLGREGIFEGRDYRNHSVIAALRAVPDSPWFLVARRDSDEVFAPVRERLRQVMVMIAVLLFGAIATIGMAWRHQRVQVYREKAAIAGKLRESNEYLENLINYANAPIIVWDAGFCITRFNRAFEILTGCSEADVLGRSLEFLFPPALVDDSMALIRKAQAGERWETIEIKILHRNGTIRTILWNSAAIYSADSKTPIATIAQGHDITEQRKIEQQWLDTVETLQKSEARYRNIVEASPLGLYSYELIAGNRLILNGANPAADQIIGIQHESLLGKTIEEAFPKLAGTEIPEIYRKVARGEIGSQHFQTDYHDGPVSGCYAVIVFQSTPQNIVVSFEDITQRRQAEEKLASAMEHLRISNRDLEQFAYIASHDLQEPLRMVANYMQLIERRYKDKLDQDAKDFIGYAVDGAVRMQQLIDSLLDYSRLQTRKNPFATVSLDQVLQRVLRDLEGRIVETGAQVSADPLPQVYGDALQIGLVFQNLITNAIKFRGEASPRVHISAAEFSKYWKLTVRDNGIGIAPEHQERIFKIFQRLHSRAEYPGTGIGLAICRRIIERHGGETGVESELKKGSAFWFTLPKKGEK